MVGTHRQIYAQKVHVRYSIYSEDRPGRAKAHKAAVGLLLFGHEIGINLNVQGYNLLRKMW